MMEIIEDFRISDLTKRHPELVSGTLRTNNHNAGYLACGVPSAMQRTA